jgi:hypothetical protein
VGHKLLVVSACFGGLMIECGHFLVESAECVTLADNRFTTLWVDIAAFKAGLGSIEGR